MPKFPEPPSSESLARIEPEIRLINSATEATRLFSSRGHYPTRWNAFRYFGPTASRFDHHLFDRNGEAYHQSRGIMYLATGNEAIPTCLAEVFQVNRIINRVSNSPVLSAFAFTRPLHLLNLTGHFATTIGASTAINSGARPRARRWSQQLYLAYPDIDGILYASSMYGSHEIIALFERAVDAIPQECIFHRHLNDPVIETVVQETAAKISYNVV